jgi:hypothetical protein
VVRFLQAALESPEQSRLLADMLGPEFAKFKERVKQARAAGK